MDVIRLAAERLGMGIRIVQLSRDDMAAALRVGKINCAVGMEITDRSRRLCDLTNAYYSRKCAVFSLKGNSAVLTIEDLRGLIVAGYDHPYFEERLRRMGTAKRIRIRQVLSGERSFRMLRQGQVAAAILPRTVGFYLATHYGVGVKIIDETDPGYPVGMGVAQGNLRLRNRLNRALEQLRKSGELDRILRRWQRK